MTRWLPALAATWALAGWDAGRAAAGGGLFQLLLLAPLTIAALAEIARSAPAAPEPGKTALRSTPDLVVVSEWVLFVGLFAACLSYRAWGLRYGDAVLPPLLAAGLVLLLAHRSWRVLTRLRSGLGSRLRSRPSLAFFFLPLTIYLALLPWSTYQRPLNGDEPYYLLLAHSLGEDLDLDLADEYRDGVSLDLVGRPLEPQFGDPTGIEGEVYSRHSFLLPAFLAFPYRLGGKLGALATMAALAAVLAWLFLRLAERYWPHRPDGAILAYAMFAFAPPLLLFSYQLWAEVPAAVLTVVAVDQILRLDERKKGRWKAWLLISACAVLLPVLKLRFALLTPPLLALAVWQSRASLKRRGSANLRGVVLTATALALTGGALLFWQELRFGSALRVYEWGSVLELLTQPPGRYLRGALGSLFDGAFGLTANAPIWLLFFPGLLLVLQSERRPAFHFFLLFSIYLVFQTGRVEWYGGWSPPFRYGLITLPFLALFVVPLLDERKRLGAQIAIWFLGTLTLSLAVLWVVFPNWTYNLADGGSHLLDHLAVRLETDVGRFAPSYIRPNLAAWLWPPIALAMLTVLWWLPLPRGERSSTPAVFAGTAAVLLLLATGSALAVASRQLPTRVVELEDPQIERNGGSLFPERWTVARHRFVGAWKLAAGDSLVAPINSGGTKLELGLRYRTTGPMAGCVLEVGSPQSPTIALPIEASPRWTRLPRAALDWPRGERNLSLSLSGRPCRGRLLADRLDLDWR